VLLDVSRAVVFFKIQQSNEQQQNAAVFSDGATGQPPGGPDDPTDSREELADAESVASETQPQGDGPGGGPSQPAGSTTDVNDGGSSNTGLTMEQKLKFQAFTGRDAPVTPKGANADETYYYYIKEGYVVSVPMNETVLKEGIGTRFAQPFGREKKKKAENRTVLPVNLHFIGAAQSQSNPTSRAAAAAAAQVVTASEEMEIELDSYANAMARGRDGAEQRALRQQAQLMSKKAKRPDDASSISALRLEATELSSELAADANDHDGMYHTFEFSSMQDALESAVEQMQKTKEATARARSEQTRADALQKELDKLRQKSMDVAGQTVLPLFASDWTARIFEDFCLENRNNAPILKTIDDVVHPRNGFGCPRLHITVQHPKTGEEIQVLVSTTVMLLIPAYADAMTQLNEEYDNVLW